MCFIVYHFIVMRAVSAADRLFLNKLSLNLNFNKSESAGEMPNIRTSQGFKAVTLMKAITFLWA